MKILTDRVLAQSKDSQPLPRQADIVLDDDEVFADLRDTDRIIHVIDGLSAHDIAVDLEFFDDQDPEIPSRIGRFIVTHINQPFDGGGIIVGTETLAMYGEQVGTPRTLAILALLETVSD